MSVFDCLDATRVCGRWSPDASAWAMPAPEPVRRPAPAVAPEFSWLSLARNPRAAAVAGLFGPLLAADAVLRTFSAARHA